ncbi:MAG: VWA domain-containing protein, partial [Methanoregula sp.]|nr:VWA domain-containing protein [Methanoregula sp.]
MSVWKGYIFIVGILVLIGTASASMPDKITITSSADSDSHNGWLVANGTDQAAITIKAENISLSQPVVVANVLVSVDPLYGSLTNTTLLTNSMGIATTVFRTNKTSIDNLIINVTVFNAEGGSPAIKNLKIDHDQAYYAYFDYQSEVVVDQTTPFIVTLKDRWGNRVDKKNPSTIHIAKFHYYPPPGGVGSGGLKNATSSYLTIISDSTDYEGNISLTAKVDTVAGENNIWMEHIEKVPDQYPFIVGITQAPPYFIDSVVNPSGTPPAVPADTVAYFTIIYTLRDRFGNPSGNQTARIFTSDNESIGDIRSNSLGQIWVTYGPKSVSGEFNITAVAIENSTVSCSDIVKFYSTDPVYMVVTANPQTMPSRDVPASQPAEVIARIMDEGGNPSENQIVTFTILGCTNTTVFTTRPSFSSSTYLTVTSATTDANGTAIVNFYPGAFPVSGPYYNSTATGTANVIATWRGNSTPITLTFKNYPYLRIETSVNPKTVNVSGTFDVDIKLIGDGWKLQQKPIDVILLLDQSGSMGSSTDTNSRLYKAKQAAKVFVDQMNSTYGDRVGIMTYNQSGWVYQDLTNNLATAKNKIGSISGNTNGAHTNMRQGLHDALKKEAQSANPGSVRAVIHMTDGDWSMAGDPLARQGSIGFDADGPGLHKVWAGNVVNPSVETIYKYFPDIGGGVYHSGSIDNAPNGQKYDDSTSNWNTDQYETTQRYATLIRTYYTDAWTSNQNMSVYAANNQIRLYSLSFVQQPLTQTKSALINMANSTGAFYQHAPDQAALETLYKQIAGELRTMAGVNTQMNLNFQNVNVTFGNVTTSMPGQQVFDY